MAQQKYTFEIEETVTYTMTVLASSEEEGREKVQDHLNEGGEELVEKDSSGLEINEFPPDVEDI